MNKFLVSAALASAVVTVQPAAATVATQTVAKAPKPAIMYTPGSAALPSWTTATVFQNFQSANLSGTYKAKAGEKVTGVNVDADLNRSTGNVYMSVGADSSYKVSFGTQGVQYFSFVLYDLAASDTLALTFANGTSTTLQGLGIIGSNKTSLLGTSGRVNFDMQGLSGITSATFSTSSDCTPFTFDSLASAAPEPGTWGMMIVGFGLAGTSLRRRRKVNVAFA